MEQMNLFGKTDEKDGLPVSGKCMENLYRRLRYDAEEYVDMFGRFPEADAIFPWLFLGGSNAEVPTTIKEVETLNSLSLKEKKQVADVLAKAFCGEEFILPRERQWAEMLKKDGMKLVEVPVMERVAALRLIAVKQNGMALQYCSGMPLATEAALIQNGLAFQFLLRKLPTSQYGSSDARVYLYWRSLALSHNGLALQYMDDQEASECFLAIKQNPEAAKFVTNEDVLAKCHGDLKFLVDHLDEIAAEIYSGK